ncbi:hypothetical protein ACRQFN_02275 [Actinotignum sp. GS-2025e]|uniref:hypothetical protein n=1 Tax=unclassified Actinotignum TaxID=2632702 RepID=UPI003F480020
MPLPPNNTSWPPTHPRVAHSYREHNAWWIGDPRLLASVYQKHTTEVTDRASIGLFGHIRRFFWGKPQALDNSRPNLHLPLAADIAATSANILYATPPEFTTENTTARERLATYIDNGLHGALLEGAEIGAAFGGRFHAVTQIPGVNGGIPFLETIDPRCAAPEFQWGHLIAVTFATRLGDNGSRTMWHVERHELHPSGLGLVFHGLYEGTDQNLGRRISLDQHPATASLAPLVDDDGLMRAEPTPGLNVAYIPNMLPNRAWRDIPGGASLGRSDFAGVEGLFDALDETWTSWIRDLRLGRARLVVSKDVLEPGRPGSGASFDLDREVFTPLDGILPTRDSGLPIEPVQFAIRVTEHAQTADALVSEIIRATGYSENTFGDRTGDTDITATEIRARERRTLTTRGKKIRLEKIGVLALVEKMLTLDGIEAPDDLAVEFEETVHESTSERAQTASLLRSADAASRYTRVKLVNPDWDDEQVAAEMQRMKDDETLADPMAFDAPKAFKALAEHRERREER